MMPESTTSPVREIALKCISSPEISAARNDLDRVVARRR